MELTKLSFIDSDCILCTINNFKEESFLFDMTSIKYNFLHNTVELDSNSYTTHKSESIKLSVSPSAVTV